MSYLEAIVLGIVQGLTEFLPISSSGHLFFVPQLLGWEDPGASFTAVVQLGTMAAVLLFFWRDILRIVSAWTRSEPSLHQWPFVVSVTQPSPTCRPCTATSAAICFVVMWI